MALCYNPLMNENPSSHHAEMVAGPERSLKSEPWFYALLPALVVALFYLPVLKNSFVNWDDREFITENPHIRHLDLSSLRWMLTTFYSGNWIPLTWLSLALNFWMGGLDPRIYHLTNLVLHALNTALVFFVCRRVLNLAEDNRIPVGNTGRNTYEIPAALLAALLFGLHPIHVESVAWATERKDVLFAFFYLLGLLLYMNYASSPLQNGLKLYSCLGLYLLALMSKPMAVTLPLVFLILDGWPLGRFQTGLSKVLTEKIPFFILALAVGLFTVLSHVQTLSSTDIHSQIFWIMNAFHALIFYLWKMAVPVNLVPLYPFPHNVNRLYQLENLLAVFLVALIFIACSRYRKKAPYLSVAWLYYLITLAPVLGLLQVGSQAAADRYTYLPSLAVFVPFSAGLASCLSNRRLLLALFIGVLTAVLGFATIRQIGVWKDSRSLWENVVRVYPDDTPDAHTYLGCTYSDEGRWDDAMSEFNRALAISPPLAITHNGMGIALLNQGKAEDAIREFKLAASMDSHTATPYRNLWMIYKNLGRHKEAADTMLEAVKIEPDNADNYGKLGASYGYLKKLADAKSAYGKAHELDPYNPKYLVNLAVISQMQGRPDEAIEKYRQGIAFNPKEPVYYLKLSDLYRGLGNMDLAQEFYEKARSLSPLGVEISK